MRKLLIALCLILSLPAFAQRGPDGRPLQNYAETCTVYGTVATGTSCSGRPKVWCVNYTTNIIYACDPTTAQWEAVGSAAGGGSGGTTIDVWSNGSSIVSAADTLNYSTDFTVSDAGSGQANIGVNDSALVVNLANGTGTVAIANGGTGATTAGTALSGLGAAARGANSDITSLSGLTTPLPVTEGGSGLNAVTTNQTFVGSASNTFIARTVPNCSAGSNIQFKTSGTCSATGETGPCWDCAADGAAGTGTLKDVQEEGVTLGASGSGTTLNFVGNPITASGTGATKTITLSTTPDSASAVGSGRTLTGGTGINVASSDSAQDLTADRTITTDSQEASFLADGGAVALTCGASNQGKMQVMDAGPASYCDGAATSVVQYTALADSSGNALTGDSAASFFQAGVMEAARGGTNASSLGSDTQVMFNNIGSIAGDAGFTYVASTDTATVGTLVTSGGADGSWGDTFRNNTIEPSAPSSTFTFLYALGDELYKKDNGDSGNERLMLNSGNVSGDFTVSVAGVGAIGADKVTETMLKVVDSPADEECFTYETTTGDFEWQACTTVTGITGITADAGGTTAGATVTLAGGTNGIDTSRSTDTVTLNLDYTEIGAATFGSGSAFTWTFNLGAGTDPTIVGTDGALTPTGFKLDGEGTGNDVTLIERTWFSAAGCNDTTPAAFFDLEASASGGAVAACLSGSGLTRGVLDFDQTTEEDAHLSFMLPSDFVAASNLDITIKWLTSATAGDVIWGVQTSCTADAEVINTSLNTASTVTDTAKGTTLQTNDASISNVTKTGCAAGELLHIRFYRDADAGGDTVAADARLLGIEVAYRRLQ